MVKDDWKETLEEVAKLADKADNLIAATSLPVSDKIHVQGLKAGLEEISVKLRAIHGELFGHLVVRDKLFKAVKAEEARIVEQFVKLCIESMTPEPFDVLVDEIVPNLEKARQIKVRPVEELGKEMGVK